MAEKNSIDTYYALSIQFRGNDKRISVFLSPAKLERFELNLRSEFGKEAPARFFIGSTVDGKVVGINIPKIQVVNIARDEMMRKQNTVESAPDIEDTLLKALLQGQSGYHHSYVSSDEPEPYNLIEFYDDLQDVADSGLMFLGFIDEDGEDVVFNVHDLLYCEVPEAVIKHEEALQEEDEETEIDD